MVRTLIASTATLCACASSVDGPVGPAVTPTSTTLADACAALAALDSNAVAATQDDHAHASALRDAHAAIGTCVVGDGGGAWALVTRDAVIGGADADDAAEEPPLELSLDLCFVAADGRTTCLPRAFVASAGTLARTTYAIVVVHDWDDDGVPEVAVEERWDRPDHHLRRLVMVRVAGDTIAPWEPLTGLGRPRVEDADGDGRPDIIDDAAFEQGILGPISVEPGFGRLHHALPGGRFATDDEACRTYYREVCPEPVAIEDITTADASEALLLAMCAGMYGADPGRLRRRLDAVYAAQFEGLGGDGGLPAASLDVPVRLR